MEQDRSIDLAGELMHQFADRTGLTEQGKPRRYLWTDAFAVGNFLKLHALTNRAVYLELALKLVDQVHQVLARHRQDDMRSGWISGLDRAEGGKHPTAGGVRIGKRLPERRPDEVFDRQLEWDRDGQYFHYLTKWMQALRLTALATGEADYLRWSVELGRAAHEGFTYRPGSGGSQRLHWKMSIDLSRPLVNGMGQHDPIDGYITFLQLQADEPTALAREIPEMLAICREQDWATDDPLGLGGLLCDSLRLARLGADGADLPGGLLGQLLASAAEGLEAYARQNPLGQQADLRLAFRELGLAIGMQRLTLVERFLRDNPDAFEPSSVLVRLLDACEKHRELAVRIVNYWLLAENRRVSNWIAHRDINTVMLVASLLPGDDIVQQSGREAGHP